MKKLFLSFALAILASAAIAQINPSYQQFNTNRFITNGAPWKIDLQEQLPVFNLIVYSNNLYSGFVIGTNTMTVLSNVNVGVNTFVSNSVFASSNVFVTNNVYAGTNASSVLIGNGAGLTNLPATTWVANLGYEYWYDPMVSINGANNGQLNWTAGSGGTGGGLIEVSNAPAHFGTITIGSASTATGSRYIFLSDTANSKPTIPRMDQAVGWTNIVVWRLNGTNNIKMYIVFQNGNITHNNPMENSIGIAYLTNAAFGNQIVGHTSASSSITTTNLGTIESGVWYTNQIWSANAGTILFNLNGGPVASIATTLPTSGLTPMIGLVKTASTSECWIEIDVWILITQRGS